MPLQRLKIYLYLGSILLRQQAVARDLRMQALLDEPKQAPPPTTSAAGSGKLAACRQNMMVISSHADERTAHPAPSAPCSS